MASEKFYSANHIVSQGSNLNQKQLATVRTFIPVFYQGAYIVTRFSNITCKIYSWCDHWWFFSPNNLQNIFCHYECWLANWHILCTPEHSVTLVYLFQWSRSAQPQLYSHWSLFCSTNFGGNYFLEIHKTHLPLEVLYLLVFSTVA